MKYGPRMVAVIQTRRGNTRFGKLRFSITSKKKLRPDFVQLCKIFSVEFQFLWKKISRNSCGSNFTPLISVNGYWSLNIPPLICPRIKHVRQILQLLNSSTVSGLDGILAIILKVYATELVRILTRILQISYNEGVFLGSWKSSRVQLVP